MIGTAALRLQYANFSVHDISMKDICLATSYEAEEMQKRINHVHSL